MQPHVNTEICQGIVLVLTNPHTGAWFTYKSQQVVDQEVALTDFSIRLFSVHMKQRANQYSTETKRKFVDYMIESGNLQLVVVTF